MIVEGQQVAYAGDDPGVPIGTRGTVLALSGDMAHTQWAEGITSGRVDLVALAELVPHRRQARDTPALQFEDTYDLPSIVTVAVRETYDDLGEDGLINALDEAGHIAMLADYAAEAIGYVALRVKQDPSFSLVLAHLDETEGDSVAHRVASALIAEHVLGEGD